MGTRGAYGFRLHGEDKVSYNHFDSYPEGLGERVLSQARALMQLPLAELVGQVQAIRLVQPDQKPTAEEIARCRPYMDLGVGRQKTDDWYCLLRLAQGDLLAAAQCQRMIEGSGFLYDSLFCEWAYLLNLDEMVFEVYRGFNEASIVGGKVVPQHLEGRYALLDSEQEREAIDKAYCYGGVWLLKSYPLNALPTAEEFISELNQLSSESDKEGDEG